MFPLNSNSENNTSNCHDTKMRQNHAFRTRFLLKIYYGLRSSLVYFWPWLQKGFNLCFKYTYLYDKIIKNAFCRRRTSGLSYGQVSISQPRAATKYKNIEPTCAITGTIWDFTSILLHPHRPPKLRHPHRAPKLRHPHRPLMKWWPLALSVFPRIFQLHCFCLF